MLRMEQLQAVYRTMHVLCIRTHTHTDTHTHTHNLAFIAAHCSDDNYVKNNNFLTLTRRMNSNLLYILYMCLNWFVMHRNVTSKVVLSLECNIRVPFK